MTLDEVDDSRGGKVPGRRGPSRGCGRSAVSSKETGPAEREDEMPGRSPVSSPLPGLSLAIGAGARALRGRRAKRCQAGRRPVRTASAILPRQDAKERPCSARSSSPTAARSPSASSAPAASSASDPSPSTPRPTPSCLHVRYADEAVCIGPAPAAQSYLVMPALIQAALQTGAEAIHPGYGFLAERAEFAGCAAEQGIKFIGPSPEAHRAHGRQGGGAGDDDRRRRAGHAGLRGHRRRRRRGRGASRATSACPVMIKASAGGGGKGIRIATEASELAGAVRQRAGRGRGRLRRRRRLRREVHRRAAPHRDPGARRRLRQRHPPRRARLLASSGATRSSSRKRRRRP